MSVIYVILDVWKEDRYRRGDSFERRIEKGPYVRLYRGYQGDILGQLPDGTDEKVFEAAVGRGGYCDTCAYEYPDFGVDMPAPTHDAEVKHFEIVVREE